MDRVDSDKKANLQVTVWKDFEHVLEKTQGKHVEPEFVERFEFYERAKKAYAVIQTGYLISFK